MMWTTFKTQFGKWFWIIFVFTLPYFLASLVVAPQSFWYLAAPPLGFLSLLLFTATLTTAFQQPLESIPQLDRTLDLAVRTRLVSSFFMMFIPEGMIFYYSLKFTGLLIEIENQPSDEPLILLAYSTVILAGGMVILSIVLVWLPLWAIRSALESRRRQQQRHAPLQELLDRTTGNQFTDEPVKEERNQTV